MSSSGSALRAARHRATDPSIEAMTINARLLARLSGAPALRSESGQRLMDESLQRLRKLPLDQAALEAYYLGDQMLRQLVFDPLLPSPLVKGKRPPCTHCRPKL